MAYNKVRKRDGTVMLDLTQDTIYESHVKEGITFHNAHGEIKIGTFAPQEKIVTKNGDVIPDEGKYLSKVIVNIAGGSGNGAGIIDVTELPTENINTEAIYRVPEEVNNSPMAYLYHPSIGIMTLGQLFSLEAGGEIPVIDHVIEVDELSEPLVPMISEGENGYIATVYVLKSTGTVYVSNDGTLAATATVGEFLFGGPEGDKGYVDSVDDITELGSYAVRGEVYTVYRYWRYDGSAWSESILAIEVNELPTEDIQRNTCYILLDTTDGVETKRYFIYKGQWVEYLAPKGEITADVSGTYDVAKYSTAVVDAAGELQEKTITSNGEFLPDEGYDGFSKVTIDIPLKFQEKTITPTKEAYEIIADNGYDALSKVNVEAISDEYALVRGTLDVTANGNYNVTNYASAKINCSSTENELLKRTIRTYKNEIVTAIGKRAFAGCSSLTSVNVPAASYIGGVAFANCSALTNVIAPAASYIENNAFTNCSALTNVIAPAVTTIGSTAFYHCSSLTTIDLQNVTSIGAVTFFECTSLTAINLQNVTTIGERAFWRCYALTLTVPTLSVATTIGRSAFTQCSSLTSIDLPAVTSMGSEVFFGCRSLKSVNLPILEKVPPYTFNGCRSLTEINLPMATTIGGYAFAGCSALTEINLPAVTGIVGSAFNGCSALTDINLPMANTIGSSAFAGCRSLTEINLPAGSYIYNYAFTNCISLTEINLPAAQIIYSSAFTGCYNLSSIILSKSSMCKLYGSNAFTSTPYAGYSASFSGTPYIYVPASLVDAYKSANNWSYFASYFSAIEDMPTA